MDNDKIPCPFVYSNGKKCTGTVWRAKAYGPRRGEGGHVQREDVRKYRLWCSEKDDHAGTVSSFEGKQRMEFYSNELDKEVLDALWKSDILEA